MTDKNRRRTRHPLGVPVQTAGSRHFNCVSFMQTGCQTVTDGIAAQSGRIFSLRPARTSFFQSRARPACISFLKWPMAMKRIGLCWLLALWSRRCRADDATRGVLRPSLVEAAARRRRRALFCRANLGNRTTSLRRHANPRVPSPDADLSRLERACSHGRTRTARRACAGAVPTAEGIPCYRRERFRSRRACQRGSLDAFRPYPRPARRGLARASVRFAP